MADRILTPKDSAPARWRIQCPKARAALLVKIAGRRKRNAMARSRGFRNYAQMSEYVA